jgi:hypothetical protein
LAAITSEVVTDWTTMTNVNEHPGRLRIELLFLDLTTCTRCRAADRSLEAALDLLRDALEATGIEVGVARIHVESAEQARELRFQSSPTIRINGRDIAPELRESSCGSEASTGDGGERIACRLWVHHGREYTELPVSMIVDAILREVYAEDAMEHPADPQPYALPENRDRLFASKAAAPASAGCCSAEEQRSCCDSADKAECCGTSTAGGCGCR